jgi:hypothetical protein
MPLPEKKIGEKNLIQFFVCVSVEKNQDHGEKWSGFPGLPDGIFSNQKAQFG